ncbi:MAG: YHS domain-containing (seleno)protein, partial [bacterium]
FADGDDAGEVAPVKGKKNFKTQYMDANWLFASQENLDKFLAEPEKYAPQYGGYCAWAVAQGKTASGDPLLWTVHDDKLYLNYDQEINERWRADMENFIVAGDGNWPAVLN